MNMHFKTFCESCLELVMVFIVLWYGKNPESTPQIGMTSNTGLVYEWNSIVVCGGHYPNGPVRRSRDGWATKILVSSFSPLGVLVCNLKNETFQTKTVHNIWKCMTGSLLSASLAAAWGDQGRQSGLSCGTGGWWCFLKNSFIPALFSWSHLPSWNYLTNATCLSLTADSPNSA